MILIITFLIIFFITLIFITINLLLKKNIEPFEKEESGLVCGTLNDKCTIDSCGKSSCCDGYNCTLPNGNYQYKICTNKLFDFDFKLFSVFYIISFIDGYYYNNTTTFKDLTVHHNNYTLSKVVNMDHNGNFNLFGVKLTGFPSNKIPNDEFSIVIILSDNTDNIEEQDIMDPEINDFINDPGTPNIITFYDDKKLLFDIKYFNNYIYLIYDKEIHISNTQIFPDYKNNLTITFKNGKINIYYDGKNILNLTIGSINFDNSDFEINNNLKLFLDLHAVVVYTTVLALPNINFLTNFFHFNIDKLRLPKFPTITFPNLSLSLPKAPSVDICDIIP